MKSPQKGKQASRERESLASEYNASELPVVLPKMSLENMLSSGLTNARQITATRFQLVTAKRQLGDRYSLLCPPWSPLFQEAIYEPHFQQCCKQLVERERREGEGGREGGREREREREREGGRGRQRGRGGGG